MTLRRVPSAILRLLDDRALAVQDFGMCEDGALPKNAVEARDLIEAVLCWAGDEPAGEELRGAAALGKHFGIDYAKMRAEWGQRGGAS